MTPLCHSREGGIPEFLDDPRFRGDDRQSFLASILIISLFLSGCVSARGGQGGVSAGMGYMPSEEVAIGEKIHAQILSAFYPYTDPKVVQFINQIGNSLVRGGGVRNLPYRFTLLYNDRIYATSAPGGFVYLTTGMIHFLQNEAELAAVIAHEIGELQYADPRLSRSRKILDALTRGGAAVGPAFGEIGSLAVLGLALMNAALEGRDLTPEERLLDADRRALHAMVEAGYDPQGMIDFFYKFLKADPSLTPYFYDYAQSRPMTEERVLLAQKEFSELLLAGKSFSTNYAVYQDATKGIREMYRR